MTSLADGHPGDDSGAPLDTTFRSSDSRQQQKGLFDLSENASEFDAKMRLSPRSSEALRRQGVLRHELFARPLASFKEASLPTAVQNMRCSCDHLFALRGFAHDHLITLCACNDTIGSNTPSASDSRS